MRLGIQNQAIVDAFNNGLTVNVKNGKVFGKSGKELLPYVNRRGYRVITLDTKNGRSAIKLHRIVAYALYGNDMFENNMVVRHLDDNLENNHPTNLFLGTHSENQLDRMKRFKLHANQVKVIYNSGLSRRELSDMFDISLNTVSRIRNGHTWSDITNHVK